MNPLESLEQTCAFLLTAENGAMPAERVSRACVQRARHGADRLDLLVRERPASPCILILGEFKAGKSTLINALVGQTVAAVDVFEMTHAVCRIVPTAEGAERVALSVGKGTAPALHLTLEEFLLRCRQRSLGPYTRSVAYVRSALEMILIDTPGLGATLSHELDAMAALTTSDLCLYTVDAGSLGNARDTALMARMREIGLPFLCVLTKADMLATDELPMAVGYLADRCGLPESLVFPVAAASALQGQPEPGVERLRSYLTASVLPRAVGLRERALLAQAADIATELQIGVTEVLRSLEAAKREVDEYRAALQETANAVKNDLCHVMADRVRGQLTLAVESSLRIQMRAGADLSEQDFLGEIRPHLEQMVERPFLEALPSQLEHRFQQEWMEGIQANIALLQQQLEELREAADQSATHLMEQIIAKENQKEEAVQSAVNHVTAGIGAAGIGALAMINPLVGLAGAAAAMLYFHYRPHAPRKGQNVEQEMQQMIRTWREEVIKEWVWQKFGNKLQEINLRVVEEAAQTYALRLPDWPIPPQEIVRLIHLCKSHLTQLDRVTAVTASHA